jgi:hypothetical protein
MQFVQSLLHRLPQPLVDRLMAWRVLYPTTPLTDLPPAVKKEVTQILTSTLPEHPPAAAPPPRPANNGQRTPQLPPHVVERLKELQRSYPHPQRPVALPPPAILPTVIGTDSTTGEDVRITQTVQGTYIVGANGTGKTNIVKTLAVSAIQNGLGLCIVEPHGDLTYDILGAVPRHRQNDIVFIDVEEFEHPFGLNLFEVPEPISIRTQAQVASFVSHTFEVLWNAGFETPRLMQNLRAVTRTLIANPGSTFGDITLLYTSEETRARLLANVRNPQVLAYWEEYERLNFRDRRLLTESFLNKVSAFLDEPMICNILSQPKITINFRSIMDNSKILLIKLSPQFEEASKLIGAIVIGKLLMTAFSRADVPPERRLPFHLYVDEFQRFQSSDFATFIAEARKFNISTFLSHQTLMQLTEQNRASALAAGTIICFRVSGDDSRVLSRSFDTTPTQQIVGEEPVRAPVADVIGHLVRRGHTNTVLTEFTTRYLKPLEADIQRWGHTQSVFLFGCAECRGGDLSRPGDLSITRCSKPRRPGALMDLCIRRLCFFSWGRSIRAVPTCFLTISHAASLRQRNFWDLSQARMCLAGGIFWRTRRLLTGFYLRMTPGGFLACFATARSTRPLPRPFCACCGILGRPSPSYRRSRSWWIPVPMRPNTRCEHMPIWKGRFRTIWQIKRTIQPKSKS